MILVVLSKIYDFVILYCFENTDCWLGRSNPPESCLCLKDLLTFQESNEKLFSIP